MTAIARPTKSTEHSWLGRIPSSWKVEPFRRVFRESSEINGHTPVGQMLSVSGYRGVEPKDYAHEELRRSDDMLEQYRVVRPGQLVVNTMWMNYSGLGFSEHLGHVSPAYRCYELTSAGHDPRFLHHLLRSKAYVQGYTAQLHGIRPNSLQLSRSKLMTTPVLRPPLDEQRAIADYIDRETAKIDAVIEKQHALVDGLRAMRSAEISSLFDGHRHAMRPLKRLLAGVDQGVSPDTSGASEDADFWVLKAGCSNHGVFNPDEVKPLPRGFAVSPQMEIKTGDLIVSRASGSPGLVASAAIVGALVKRTILSDKTFRLVVSDERYARSLYWYMNSLEFRDEVLQRISGADGLANNIPLREIRNIPVPVYSADEAAEISDHLDREVAKIDALITRSERLIELSQERRSALITAAVTGQIDITTGTMALEGAA